MIREERVMRVVEPRKTLLDLYPPIQYMTPY